jgi:hypothetical protein
MPLHYKTHPDHRNGTAQKSQWTISISSEEVAFEHAIAANWRNGPNAWGVFPVLSSPDYLGVAQDHRTRVFLAKFVGDHSDQWHGFPIDYRKSAYYVPPQNVLRSWLEKRIFARAKLRKISRGQSCSL